MSVKKKQFDLEKEVRDIHRSRVETENDIKSLTAQLQKHIDEDNQNTLYLKNDA